MRVLVLATAILILVSFLGLSSFAQQAAKVNQVVITGNVNINTDAIMNVLGVKVGGDYAKDAVEKDKQSIMSLGFFSAVTERAEEVPGGIKLTYDVTENPKIVSVGVQGSDPVPATKIEEMMRSKAGSVLNVNTLNQDIESIQAFYGEEGYIAFVTEDINIDPLTGVLKVPILVHRVEDIAVTGNKKTKTFVFLREMRTQPGSIFNVKILKDDILRIYNLDLLEDIKQYQIVPGSKMGTVKVTLPVVEKKTGQVSLGMGYSSRQRLVGQVRISETNFRGVGQGLNALWEQGTTDAVGGSGSYELGFYEPWLDKNHTSLSVSAFDKVQYRFSSGVFGGGSTLASDQTYNERRRGGEATLSRPIGEKVRAFVGARFENVDTDPNLLTGSGDLAKIVQKGDVSSISLRAVRNTRDIEMDPAAGVYNAVSLEFGKVKSVRFGAAPTYSEIPFSGNFTKTSVDLRMYISKLGRKINPTDKRTTLAIRLRAGVSSGTIPFFEQFFVGGGESLRGYREDRFWGDKMMLVSVELRHPVASSVGGVVFADYGGAWGAPDEFMIGELTQHKSFKGAIGAGLGIRVVTPIGHIRLDYGTGSEGGRTHFSMGQAF